jgi:hypothetical protein
MDNKKLLEEIETLIERKFEEYLDGENTTKSSGKILDNYDNETVKVFWQELKKEGSTGLEKLDIMQIFDVKKSQAYNIQQKLAAQYEFIEYHKRPGKSALTRHKKYAYAEELGRATSSKPKNVIEQIESSLSEGETLLEVLEEKWEELQKKRKNKRKRGSRFH